MPLASSRSVHADGGHQIGDLERGEGAHDGEGDADGGADELVRHLGGVAIDPAESGGLAVGQLEPGVDQAGGEHAGQETSHHAAHAVNAEGVERIVVAEFLLHHGDHQEADGAGDQTDEHGGEGFARSRRPG